ncbi:hypothetical protein D3C80_1773820 [compost metagenome]
MWEALCFSSSARISRTSLALRTKEAAIKSMSCPIPKTISLVSFSVMPGREIETPGTLTPFLLLIVPPLTIRVLISVP